MAGRVDRQDVTAMEARIADLDGQKEALRVRMVPLERAVKRISVERASLRDSIADVKVSAMGSQPDWAYLIIEDNSAATQGAWFKAVWALGLWPSGYYPETHQRAAKLMMTRGDAAGLEKTIDAVGTLLPHCKPLSDGFVCFGIFEHTLSEHGSYVMRIRPNLSEITVGDSRGHRAVKFGGLREAISHVQETHWYNSPDEPVDDSLFEP